MEYNKKFLTEIDLKDKTVVLRLDLNVPIVNHKITDFTRIDASLPTLKYLLEQNDKIVVLSHLGRINSYDDIKKGNKSLETVVPALKDRLPGVKINFCNSLNFQEIKNAVFNLQPKEILLLQNTRYFNIDPTTHAFVNLESSGDAKLAKFYASLGDVYINDAFATLHRNHASNALIARFQPNNAIGFLVKKELDNLGEILNKPKRPFVCIFGGGKVRDKINTLYKALEIADKVFISGGMTYTFAKAMGYDVGKSKVEEDLFDVALDILKKDKKHKIVLAQDYLGVKTFKDEPGTVINIGSKEAAEYMGLDIGPKTEKKYHDELQGAKTVFYNGPLGVFEFDNFQHGTKSLFHDLAELTKNGAKVIIGGGDSASAAVNFGYQDAFSFISTGGGASMRYLEDEYLPGLYYMQDKNLTPHINANKNMVSKYVLFCGDPLRAKWIAENYLTDAVLVNSTRNMFGYSGYYKGLFVTVMGHGMGIPSVGIYSYELYKFFDVDLIVRMGTAGGLRPELAVNSLIVAKQVYSDSHYAQELGLKVQDHIIKTNKSVLTLTKKVVNKNKFEVLFDNVISTDCFYTVTPAEKLAKKGNSSCVEMEVFGLYCNAMKLRKKALALLTVSDNVITHDQLTSEQRQTSLRNMAKLGLEIVLACAKIK